MLRRAAIVLLALLALLLVVPGAGAQPDPVVTTVGGILQTVYGLLRCPSGCPMVN